MRVRGKITEEELTEVRNLVRSKWYWPKLLIANWYGILLLCAVLWATVEGLIGNTHPNWQGVGIIWLVVGGIFGWSFYSAKQSSAKDFFQLDKTLPDWINLDNTGAKLEGPNEANLFFPWQNFKSWREGRKVVLLTTQNGALVILPIAVESQIERGFIQQLIVSHIATKL